MTGSARGEAVARREEAETPMGKWSDGVGVVVMACVMLSPACCWETVDWGGKPTEVKSGVPAPPPPPPPGCLLDAINFDDLKTEETERFSTPVRNRGSAIARARVGEQKQTRAHVHLLTRAL